ncbi:uncharacterized protein KY384_007543 [Bacidia gigantensis]|uniref:uncharacterized protein n=1 Tax=Bacidia gigantensis TaxID=2732470 RepID=UPI001D0408E8|nr:uncharacterized protein KY384_007543 [Bacidia gigantensis]KAG8527391.1 hypothetical protein KY384_007543 [Bacidia gigantensis]
MQPLAAVSTFEANGISIPAVGLGTWQSDSGDERVKDVVSSALRQGYRHIDCAAAYGNEKEIGEAIRESGVSREELFITTKLQLIYQIGIMSVAYLVPKRGISPET